MFKSDSVRPTILGMMQSDAPMSFAHEVIFVYEWLEESLVTRLYRKERSEMPRGGRLCLSQLIKFLIIVLISS